MGEQAHVDASLKLPQNWCCLQWRESETGKWVNLLEYTAFISKQNDGVSVYSSITAIGYPFYFSGT